MTIGGVDRSLQREGYGDWLMIRRPEAVSARCAGDSRGYAPATSPNHRWI